MNSRRAGLLGVVLVALTSTGSASVADATVTSGQDRGRERGAAQTAPTRVEAAGDRGQEAAPTGDLMRKWSRSCALCHVDGNARAPRVGVAEEWQPRRDKGMDVLLDHTINGLNKMPPLGYCMSCEAEDFRALIEFMAGARP